MLPSGNDAAQALCETVGKLLSQLPEASETKDQNCPASEVGTQGCSTTSPSSGSTTAGGSTTPGSQDQSPLPNNTNLTLGPSQSSHTIVHQSSQQAIKKKKENITKYFIQRMNRAAIEVGMSSSSFCNPHGLVNKHNHSTCLDMAMLMNRGMKQHHEFLKVISTSSYTTSIKRDDIDTEVSWKNTHKCFDDVRFLGGKTGITISAGPCLASIMKLTNGRKVSIILLNCSPFSYNKVQVRMREH